MPRDTEHTSILPGPLPQHTMPPPSRFTVMDYAQRAASGWARFENAEIHLYVKEDHDPGRTAACADLTVVDCEAVGLRLRPSFI